MGKIEEISDMMTPETYTAKKDGKFVFIKGKLLRFDYEGSKTELRVTKIDRKNQRMWAEHVQTGDQFEFIESHHGHLLDVTKEAYEEFGTAYCQDCEVPVTTPSTEDGEVKALNRVEEG